MKPTYFQNEKHIFIDSFRRIYSKLFLYISAADALFWALFYAIVFLFSAIITKASAPLQSAVFAPSAASEGLKYFLIKAFLLLILAIGLIFLIWSFSRCLIWCKLLKQKFTFKHGLKFTLFNLIWTIILFIPIAASVSSIYQKVKMNVFPTTAFFIINYIFLLVIVYLTYIFFFTFTKNRKIFLSFWEGICAAFEKAPKLAPQFILMLAVLFIISFALNILRSFPLIHFALGFIFMVGSLSWGKIYFSAVMEDKLAKHKNTRFK